MAFLEVEHLNIAIPIRKSWRWMISPLLLRKENSLELSERMVREKVRSARLSADWFLSFTKVLTEVK